MSSHFSLDNRFRLQRGSLHLSFRIGDKRLAYAYIRKNGCSAFKKALGFRHDVDVSEVAGKFPWKPWQRHDATIFVWRDPVDRLVSLYRNKILDGRNNADILRNYRRSMGEEPSTFDRFVDFACLEADPHCLRQARHLKPIRYTHAIPLERLQETMEELIGPAAAEPFHKKVNVSVAAEPIDIGPATMSKIREHYACDFRMIDRIRAR